MLIIEKKREIYNKIQESEMRLEECYYDNARYCEEQGWPSHGSNYGLMCERDEEFYGGEIEYYRKELIRLQGYKV